jgi:hypothetical protein
VNAMVKLTLLALFLCAMFAACRLRWCSVPDGCRDAAFELHTRNAISTDTLLSIAATPVGH